MSAYPDQGFQLRAGYESQGLRKDGHGQLGPSARIAKAVVAMPARRTRSPKPVAYRHTGLVL
jgi:hypothetical protein